MIVALPVQPHWPDKLPHVRQTLDRFGYDTEAEVREMGKALIAGKAFLYGCDDGDTFAVVMPEFDRVESAVVLFVWFAWNHGLDIVTTSQGMDYLRELARGLGATRIRFKSRRRGYQVTGWRVDDIIYSRPVEE